MELEKFRNHGKGVRNKKRRASNNSYYRTQSPCRNRPEPEAFKPAKQFREDNDMTLTRMNTYLKHGYLEAVTFKSKLYVRFTMTNQGL